MHRFQLAQALTERCLSAPGNTGAPLPAVMPAPASLGPLLASLLAVDPPKRPVLLRPRLLYLPHPLRRLARLPGVVRAPRRSYRLKSMEQPSIPPMKTGWPVLIRLISDSFIGRQ